MDKQTVAALLSDLTARIDDLTRRIPDAHSGDLLTLHNTLTQLALAAIVADLDASLAAYQQSFDALNDAIACATVSQQKSDHVAETIESASKAVRVVKSLLGG